MQIYKRVFVIAVLVGVCVSLSGCIPPSWAVTEVPDSVLANARERFIELANRSPSGPYQYTVWLHTNPELHALLGAYHIAVAVRPAQRGELDFVILDEQGNQLNGVRVQALGITGVDSRYEPTVAERRIVVDGEYRLKWTNGDPLELDISKPGYRHIHVAFYPQSPDSDRRYSGAMDMLYLGYVLPPVERNAPVRIVVPAAMRWDPEEPEDYSPGAENSLGARRRQYWPSTVPASAPVVVTSADSRLVTAPSRGTYVLTDGMGRIMEVVRLDRGNEIGFLGSMSMAYGSGTNWPVEEGPYEWRLYSLAKPLTPTTRQSRLNDSAAGTTDDMTSTGTITPVLAADEIPATAPAATAPAAAEMQVSGETVELFAAGEKEVRWTHKKVREAMEQWTDLPADRKREAMACLKRLDEATDAYFAQLRSGGAVPMTEVVKFTNENNIQGQLQQVWKDDPGLIKQLHEKLAESTGALVLLTMGMGQPDHPTAEMESALAKVHLSADQQRAIEPLLEQYRTFLKRAENETEQIDDYGKKQIAGSRIHADATLLADEILQKINAVLDAEQRKELIKSVPREED